MVVHAEGRQAEATVDESSSQGSSREGWSHHASSSSSSQAYRSTSSTASTSSSAGTVPPPSWSKRMVLRVLGPSGGRNVHCPFVTMPSSGCFGVALGCCGGFLMCAIGAAQLACFCVGVGVLSEEALRRAQYRAAERQRAMAEETSSEDTEGPKGLDQAAIERSTIVSTVGRPKVSDKGSSGGADTDVPEEQCKCMICVEPFKRGESLRTLPCLHRYHRKCIDEWLRRSHLCPICKHDVTETSPRKECPPRPQGARARALSGGSAAVSRLRTQPWRRSGSVPRAGRSDSFLDALERVGRSAGR